MYRGYKIRSVDNLPFRDTDGQGTEALDWMGDGASLERVRVSAVGRWWANLAFHRLRRGRADGGDHDGRENHGGLHIWMELGL